MLTLGGAARHNVENIAAAVLAALASDLPLPALRATLAQFGAQPQDNPGRLERWACRGATVLVDYAHNPDGLAQLLQVARALMAHTRRRAWACCWARPATATTRPLPSWRTRRRALRRRRWW